MLSTPSRLRLLALLFLPLLSISCAKTSTLASIARTERPTLPKLSPELTRVERLTPLSGRTSGELVAIDKGWLGELVERYAEATGAVERGNNRAAGVKLERRCTAALFSTGVVRAGCPPP